LPSGVPVARSAPEERSLEGPADGHEVSGLEASGQNAELTAWLRDFQKKANCLTLPMSTTFDFAVIGAGVFGTWTAKYLRDSGASVVVLDAYGPGNSRSSSGGETRIIRLGYGPDELYTRWALRSFPLWRELFDHTGRALFHPTGVLWLADHADPHVEGM